MVIKLLYFFLVFFSILNQSLASISGVTFERKNIKLGNKVISVELAVTPEQHERGLMFRKELGPNSGMLFIFREKKILKFWMKNTFIPLSIGFFDEEGVLLEFFDMEPVKSELQQVLPSYSSSVPAKMALEVNRGWFKLQGIKPGDKLSYPGL